jgi:hypothetical protein
MTPGQVISYFQDAPCGSCKFHFVMAVRPTRLPHYWLNDTPKATRHTLTRARVMREVIAPGQLQTRPRAGPGGAAAGELAGARPRPAAEGRRQGGRPKGKGWRRAQSRRAPPKPREPIGARGAVGGGGGGWGAASQAVEEAAAAARGWRVRLE